MMLIVYFLMRFYLPIDKLISCITTKKKKEEKEVEQIEEPNEESTEEVEENDKEPIQVEEETCSTKDKYCFVKSLIKSLLSSVFFFIPFALMFIFVDEAVNALIIMVVMFGVNLLVNILSDLINYKSKKTFSIILDLCLHLVSIVILYSKIGFKLVLDDYELYIRILAIILLMVKPIGEVINNITNDFFDEETKLSSPDGIIGILLRLIITFLIIQGTFTAIPLILGIIVAVKYRDLVEINTRNKCIVSLLANIVFPIFFMLLISAL